MAVLIGALLLTAAAVFVVLHPILTGRAAPLARGEEEVTEAEVRKRVTLMQLRDAEYDYVTGKLDEEDYRKLRSLLSAEALEAIRAEEAGGAGAAGGDDLEAEIAAARARLRAGPFCSRCGHPNAPGSRYCAKCGTPLAAAGGSPAPAS